MLGTISGCSTSQSLSSLNIGIFEITTWAANELHIWAKLLRNAHGTQEGSIAAPS